MNALIISSLGKLKKKIEFIPRWPWDGCLNKAFYLLELETYQLKPIKKLERVRVRKSRDIECALIAQAVHDILPL